MSTTEVIIAAVLDKLDDVTNCCICSEAYTDPKILPCVHTFCMTCLERTGTQTKTRPGDSMPCPLCRQEFKVPQQGFAALPKNFFMETLVEIATRPPRRGTSIVCDKHEHENLCLFCSDCNEILCLVCLRVSHQKHRLSDLSSTANFLRSQLQSNVGNAKRYRSDALEKKERLAQKKFAILGKIQGCEREVLQVRNDLKALIDQHADSILENLDLLKKNGIEDIEIEEKELEKHLASLENFEKCCAELTSSDPHDSLICKVGSELQEQIVELQLFNKSTIECHNIIRSFEINFTKAVPEPLEAFRKTDSENLIGKVEAKMDYSINPELVATIGTNDDAETTSDWISGMTVSDNKVFILNNKNPIVRIYDSNTLNCTTRMTIKGFVSDVDLRHCASTNGSVYIVNSISREIVQIDENRVLIKWSAKNNWGRLSISASSTIVATCYNPNAIKEYTLHGTLLYEIKLCSSILHPSHAVKLDNGHFLVSHGRFKDNLNRVCIVNHVGGITKSFGDLKGSSIKQLYVPTSLAVDEDGNILVLDRNNSRVLLLGPELEFKRELLTDANGLRSPVAMHLDEKTGRLYIADNKWENSQCSDGKVFVFSIKYAF